MRNTFLHAGLDCCCVQVYEWVLNYRVRTVPEHIATSLFTAGEAGGQSSRPILPQTIPTLLGSPQI